LQTNDDNDLTLESDHFIPLAFMVWDGDAAEADERLALTGWSLLNLPSPTPLTAYIWIPIVILAVLIIELLIVWLVRRKEATREMEGTQGTVIP
jgi:hypothetical protein